MVRCWSRRSSGAAAAARPGVAVCSTAGASRIHFTGVSCAHLAVQTECTSRSATTRGSGTSAFLRGEEWNGRSWSVVSPPGPRIRRVDTVCVPGHHGLCRGGFSRYGTLAGTWNGTGWSRRAGPAPEGEIEHAQEASRALPPGQLHGRRLLQRFREHVVHLAATWNGTSWTQRKPRRPCGVAGSGLTGVASAGHDDLVAVGDFLTARERPHPRGRARTGPRRRSFASPPTEILVKRTS